MEKLVLPAVDIFSHLRQYLDANYLNTIHRLEYGENIQPIYEEEVEEALGQIVRMLRQHLNANNGAVIFSCVIYLSYLQEQKHLSFNKSQLVSLWNWMLEVYTCRKNSVEDECRLIIAIGNLSPTYSRICGQKFVAVLQLIIKNISFKMPNIVLVTTLQGLNRILRSMNVNHSDEQLLVCAEAGDRLIQLHYGKIQPKADNLSISAIVLSTFQIFDRIVALNSNFANGRTSELLGLSKAYFHYGLEANQAPLLKPQKVNISQQSFYDSAEEIETAINSEKIKNYGGKTPKTRKPRTAVKNTRFKDYERTTRTAWGEESMVLTCNIITTSESELFQPEPKIAANRVLMEHSRKPIIREAAICLIGSIARSAERKVMFGYWHALLPSGTTQSKDNLLYLGQHDPNIKCRSAALQVSAQLIYGSKGFLHQAEINVNSCPSTFVPFSVSLGYTVLALFKTLLSILATESSLPLLAQYLKCLAVLVQASPLKQFEEGFAKSLVEKVKPFIYHYDVPIQVSALMVMEYLLATPEFTSEIAEAIGVSQQAVSCLHKTVINVEQEEMSMFNITEYIEEEESDEQTSCKGIIKQEQTGVNEAGDENTFWLLKRVLRNLRPPKTTTSVCIESLRVLIAMSSHFALIKHHLAEAADVLCRNMGRYCPEVALYAARFIDACVYQINRYLLDKTVYTELELKKCSDFWAKILRNLAESVLPRNGTETTLRITICDALSNIGVVIFERMPRTEQMGLLSVLSSVGSATYENTLLRAAAARALAVYASYSTLRGDIIFIQNTAELSLKLVKDSNLLVRAKSFWSLGNITYALVASKNDLAQFTAPSLPYDQVLQLFSAATEACSDNDKVRCNAVRTLGNLLRLLDIEYFRSSTYKSEFVQSFHKAVSKLSHCLRSSGNAKVKWNTCYAITNVVCNSTFYELRELKWKETIFTDLCHVVVHQSNFKVRINAAAAILSIMQRSHFGVYFEKFWSSVLEAIEKSYNLESFHEYNHRDGLQEQLCLALAHLMKLSLADDWFMLKKLLIPRAEIIHNTWQRVINRIVPEKAAPLITCPVIFIERAKTLENLTSEKKKSLEFLANIFSTK